MAAGLAPVQHLLGPLEEAIPPNTAGPQEVAVQSAKHSAWKCCPPKKNSQAPRNEWPLGLFTQTFPSKDGNVRQVEVKIIKTGGTSLFLRPVDEIVLLLPPEEQWTVY